MERTVAGVQADDEARLLFDFLRHPGGGGVVGGRWISRRGNLGSAVGVGAAAKRLDVSRHVRVLKTHCTHGQSTMYWAAEHQIHILKAM